MNFWSDRIEKWGAQLSDRPAFSDARESISFSKLNDQSRVIAKEIREAGLLASDRVAISLLRSPLAALSMASLLRAGISAITIDRGQLVPTFARLNALLGFRAIFCYAADQSLVASLFSTSETVKFKIDDLVLVINKSPTTPSPYLEGGWLLQTSGSTRTPRVVMIDINNLVERALGEVRDFKLCESDKLINSLPFSHDLGLNQFLSALAAGLPMKIQNQPFTSSLIQLIRESGSTGISGTPLMWTQVMAQTSVPFAGFRYVTVSGGSLPGRQLLELAKQFPGAEIIRTYGQTETFRTLLCRDLDNASNGTPIEGVTARIVDADGNECTQGETGELIHSGAGAMIGYFGDAANTASGSAREHGIKTGDLFARRSDGFYYVGRNDDMIKRFDTRVHTKEIELTIAERPEVTEVAIVTKPAPEGDTRQTLIHAFVQLRIAASLDSSAILNHCKRQLANHKIPDVVTFVSDFPRTESLKIDRKALAASW